MNHRASDPKRRYAEILLDAYGKAPETPPWIAHRDRSDALRLYDQGVPLSWALAAIQFAILQRVVRPHDALPLEPIGSLRYFFPVIDMLAKDLQEPGCLGYLDFLSSTYEAYRNTKWPPLP